MGDISSIAIQEGLVFAQSIKPPPNKYCSILVTVSVGLLALPALNGSCQRLPTLRASTTQVGKLLTTTQLVFMSALLDLREDEIPPSPLQIHALPVACSTNGSARHPMASLYALRTLVRNLVTFAWVGIRFV